MEILYVWIEEYRRIERQGFHLSNEFGFSFDPEAMALEINVNPDFIPSFWGRGVSGVSALVGENGSGKSSTLEFIRDHLFPRQGESPFGTSEYRTQTRVVIVTRPTPVDAWSADESREPIPIQVYTHPHGEISIMAEGISVDMKTYALAPSDDAEELKAMRGILYSNVFDAKPEDGWYARGDQLDNLTTSYLVRHDKISITNDARDESADFTNEGAIRPGKSQKRKVLETIPPNDVEAHRLMELRRNVSFIAEVRETLPDFEIPFLLPDAVLVTANPYNEKRVKRDGEWARALERLPQTRGVQNSGEGFSDGIALAALCSFIRSQLMPVGGDRAGEQDGTASAEADEQLDGRLQQVVSCLQANSIQQGVDAVLRAAVQGRFDEEGRRSESDVVRAARRLQAFLQVLRDLVSGSRIAPRPTPTLQISTEEEGRRTLRKLLDAYLPTVGTTGYLDFCWSHPLSSGEQSWLTLFSRFWSVRKRESELDTRARNRRAGISRLVMIDEGDLYFHPKWQRRFLSLLLRFLPRCFEGVPVQLVLTSNSPFVVSDLPRSCITFVEGPGPGRASVRVLGQSQVMAKGATFAANIHLLLADSFFMGHALAGEFSTRKLQELISFLSSSASRKGGQHSCEESRWLDEGTADSLIEQIGEPVLRNKLREMYNEQFLGNAEHNSLEKRIRRAEADLDDLRSRHRNMVERRDDQD